MERTVVRSKQIDRQIIVSVHAIAVVMVFCGLLAVGYVSLRSRIIVPVGDVFLVFAPAYICLVLGIACIIFMKRRHVNDHREMILFEDILIVRSKDGTPQVIPTEEIEKTKAGLLGTFSVRVQGRVYRLALLKNAPELQNAIRQSVEMRQNSVMASEHSASEDLPKCRRLVEMGILTETDYEKIQGECVK